MMQLLGIEELRPGRNGNPEATVNPANYDPALANPFQEIPDALQGESGQYVGSADAWWSERRPEIQAAFAREVYGEVPPNAPAITWQLDFEEREFLGWTPVTVKKLIGKADNSSYPAIDVRLELVVVTPANAAGPVPLLVQFGSAAPPAPVQPTPADFERLNRIVLDQLRKDPEASEILEQYPAYRPLVRPEGVTARGFWQPPDEPGRIHQLINAGWGYAYLDPASIQPDNGGGLSCEGIIALAAKGQPRSPGDWGALRAWAWGASRTLDYLETDRHVDASRVGIEGVSRYGKAALVAMAFEQRFAVALIGSSGKGGTTLHRRNFGEAVENLTGGFYYWMAGNYMKYATERGTSGPMDASHLPVDSHELIALCAPRPVFVSYGVPEAGDAHWLDHQGSFMAVVAASPVYELLGEAGIEVDGNYRTARMPPVNDGLLQGKLAWRQHDGGHTDSPNIPHFIDWANRQLGIEARD